MVEADIDAIHLTGTGNETVDLLPIASQTTSVINKRADNKKHLIFFKIKANPIMHIKQQYLTKLYKVY